MGSDKQGQLLSQPVVTPVPDLDDLLSKLSTWDGSSSTTHNEPTSSTVTQEVHRVDEGGRKIPSSGENHLEMKEIEPKDIHVILHLSGVDSPSRADAGNGEDGQILNVEAVRVEGGTNVSSTSELNSTGEAPVGDEIVESSHIWYACYGSNMYKPRFMCYIQGGRVNQPPFLFTVIQW